MNKTSSKWILVFAMMIVCVITTPVRAYGSGMVPSTIRIGLRSAYSDKASIDIKNTEIEIGYESDNRFVPQGTLISNTGFVMKPNQKQYYSASDTFYTYNEAAYSALKYKEQGIAAVVVYGAPTTWGIYLEQNLGNMNPVNSTGAEVMIQDGLGMDLLLFENNGVEPTLVGKNRSKSFDLTELSKGSYRGWFEFKRKGSTITAINIVDYEEYLYGVVAAEMPASWHMEALKAQAIAARSMSIHQKNKYLKDGYNVCDTVYTQVYKGFSWEYPRTNQAVDETRGMVATYNGKIAETLFFSTSGGYTEDPQYVWGNPIAYLKAVPDPYETDPEGKPWTRTITLSELDLCLSKQNISIGNAQGVKVNSYTPAGRVNELEIMGTSGTYKIIRENIRTFFASTNDGSLRSRMFTLGNAATISQSEPLESITVYKGEQPKYLMGANGKIVPVTGSLVVEGTSGKTTYGATSVSNQGAHATYGNIVVSGQGYGHGVGMSQSGARGMADAGHTFDQIIKYYYQSVEIQR